VKPQSGEVVVLVSSASDRQCMQLREEKKKLKKSLPLSICVEPPEYFKGLSNNIALGLAPSMA
jgi:hypothetical protein